MSDNETRHLAVRFLKVLSLMRENHKSKVFRGGVKPSSSRCGMYYQYEKIIGIISDFQIEKP